MRKDEIAKRRHRGEFIRYPLSIANEFATSRPDSEYFRYDPNWPSRCDHGVVFWQMCDLNWTRENQTLDRGVRRPVWRYLLHASVPHTTQVTNMRLETEVRHAPEDLEKAKSPEVAHPVPGKMYFRAS